MSVRFLSCVVIPRIDSVTYFGLVVLKFLS
jgi:hypothetical protein